jgi:hypothetical protein
MPHLENAVITAMQENLNCGQQRVKHHAMKIYLGVEVQSHHF